MTDYLGPIALGTSGTYRLTTWEVSDDATTVAVEVIVVGTTADNLTTAVETLIAQLVISNTYIHYQPGNTNPVVYFVMASNLKLDKLVSWQVFWQRMSFTLSLSTLPRGALVTLYNAVTVQTPASNDLAGLVGTHPTTLDVTIDDSTGSDMHSVWCVLAPSALTDAKWLVLASALTWTTMSSGTGATMWGNVSRYTTSASVQTAPLDTSLYPSGKYRLLARVQQSAGTGYVKDSQNDAWVAVTRTSPHLMVIGDVDLPVSDTASGTAANLTLSVKSDGTNTFTVNAFVLLPLEYGLFSWHDTVSTTGVIDQIDDGPTGQFQNGVYDATYKAGGMLSPRTLATHCGTLVATASPTGTTWPTDWGRTNGTDVTAASSKFHVVCAATTTKTATYAATNAATPLITPGVWYELSLTRQVTAWTAGTVQTQIVWQDVDGNTIRTDSLSSVAATDASPVNLVLYAKAPPHSARAQVLVGGILATATADFSAVVLRRSPMRLIIVAETPDGSLTSNTHAVALTVRYTPRYQIAR
jgi:hypothetical protein